MPTDTSNVYNGRFYYRSCGCGCSCTIGSITAEEGYRYRELWRDASAQDRRAVLRYIDNLKRNAERRAARKAARAELQRERQRREQLFVEAMGVVVLNTIVEAASPAPETEQVTLEEVVNASHHRNR